MITLKKIYDLLLLIKQILISYDKDISIDGYINKKTLKKFLDYSDSSIKRLEAGGLNYKTLGDRRFYKKVDVLKLLIDKKKSKPMCDESN